VKTHSSQTVNLSASTLTVVLVGVASLVLWFFGVRRSLIAQLKMARGPEQVSVATPVLSKSDTPYTLVEFGDYQCPPCRMSFAKVEAIRNKLGARLTFRWHHFPLTNIHPNAFLAALVSASARDHGKFEQMHKLLMEGATDPEAIKQEEKELALPVVDLTHPKPELLQSVKEDLEAGRKLSVLGTPTFFLVTPAGAYRLHSLDDAEQLIGSKSEVANGGR